MMEERALLCVLKQGLLFRNMEDGEILEALETMQPRQKTYPKRTLVVRDGDLLPQIGVILSGGLHLFHIDADGNNNLMEQLGQGDSLGILNAVGGYKLHISAETTEQTEILFLTVDQLLRDHVLTAPVPVSYTHLDVYKRQSFPFRIRIICCAIFLPGKKWNRTLVTLTP